MYDVIVVGGGISGCMMTWRLLLEGKSVCLIADNKPGSSHVAAGVYNPVVLKRFTPVWKAKEQIASLENLSMRIEQQLGQELFRELPILRRFHNPAEVKTWVKKRIKPELEDFLGEVVNDPIPSIEAHHGFGITNHTGFLDCHGFIQATLDYSHEKFNYLKTEFDHAAMSITDSQVAYANVSAERVIFCEGYQVLQNKIFPEITLQGNKGETLIVRILDFALDCIIKGSVFLMPYRNDLFWVGATYAREYGDKEPSWEGKEFLTSRLESMLRLPYEIVAHTAGIRPTTHDRRPIVGTHSELQNVHIFNGMGSRAVLITPWTSKILYDHIYNSAPLPSEMDVGRFYS